jgi:hypothetical protein
VAAGLFKRGVLVAGTLTSAHTIRIEPPLVITYEQIDAVLDRLAETLAEQDVLICVPTSSVPRVVESQFLVIHCLCDGIDFFLLGA